MPMKAKTLINSMINIKKLQQNLLLCSLIFLSSCTRLFIAPIEKQEIVVKKNIQIGKSCTAAQKSISLLGKYKNDILLFNEFSKAYYHQFQPVELFSLLALTHMNFFPHKITPFSKFQIITNLNGELKIFDFPLPINNNNKKSQANFLIGLQTLLKTYKSKRDLKDLAKILDNKFSQSIPVNKELATFLKENRATLYAQKVFNDTFFKADMLIEEKETFKKINFKNLIKSFKITETKKNYLSHLFPFENETLLKAGWTVKCNVDLHLYRHEIYPLSDNFVPIPFGISFPNRTFILGVANQKVSSIKPIKKTFLVQGISKSNKSVFCHLTRKKQENIYLFSTKGKDPGQYIFQALKSKTFNNLQDLQQLIENYRTLHLNNPHRVLYESTRGTPESLNKLLSQTKPVYHTRSLGNIWAYSDLKNGFQTFITDSRTNSYLLCH